MRGGQGLDGEDGACKVLPPQLCGELPDVGADVDDEIHVEEL
jgi:hypothetical protein